MAKAEPVKPLPLQILDELCEGRSQRAVAGALDVSAQYLNDVILGQKEPGEKILVALGLERVITYKRVGPAPNLDHLPRKTA